MAPMALSEDENREACAAHVSMLGKGQRIQLKKIINMKSWVFTFSEHTCLVCTRFEIPTLPPKLKHQLKQGSSPGQRGRENFEMLKLVGGTRTRLLTEPIHNHRGRDGSCPCEQVGNLPEPLICR